MVGTRPRILWSYGLDTFPIRTFARMPTSRLFKEHGMVTVWTRLRAALIFEGVCNFTKGLRSIDAYLMLVD